MISSQTPGTAVHSSVERLTLHCPAASPPRDLSQLPVALGISAAQPVLSTCHPSFFLQRQRALVAASAITRTCSSVVQMTVVHEGPAVIPKSSLRPELAKISRAFSHICVANLPRKTQSALSASGSRPTCDHDLSIMWSEEDWRYEDAVVADKVHLEGEGITVSVHLVNQFMHSI